MALLLFQTPESLVLEIVQYKFYVSDKDMEWVDESYPKTPHNQAWNVKTL